jgi:alkanesulfonate monooxygenase SsuD/methylene tetrahydromethanopterin reductase-like flavin-dependent oxidoreductase (luciferase family)
VTQIGISVNDSVMVPDPAKRRSVLDRVAAVGLDHVTVGDHVSFHGGVGFDGLMAATSVLSSHDDLSVVLGVYQLALRHPLLVARQLASISQLAPGRLVFGVGVGGEDRAEVSNSGVDPATRGRRLDECLAVIHSLASGRPVDHAGTFFTLAAAAIHPAPSPRVPVVIGGKGAVAVRRTAAFGDGWLGMFCSDRRFAHTKQQIAEAASALGRGAPPWYGLSVWCGLDEDENRARDLLSHEMESLYRLPYEKFARVAPAGTPAQVATWLAPFVEAGAEHITIIPAALSPEAGVDLVAEVRGLLRA